MQDSDDFYLISQIEIPEGIPQAQLTELQVFQKAMAALESEYISTQNGMNPLLHKISKQNSSKAKKKCEEFEIMRNMKLDSCKIVYEEEKKNIEKKFDNAKKSQFERFITTLSKCDSNIVQESKSISENKKNGFDFNLLEMPRYPQESQIMQKVLHVPPRPVHMLLPDHDRDHDYGLIKAEITKLHADQSDKSNDSNSESE